MNVLNSQVVRLVLVATVTGAIGTSALQAQIGPGGSERPAPVSPATLHEHDSGTRATLYGTGDATSHTLQAFAFESLPLSASSILTGDFYSRYCTSGTCVMEAPLQLPEGASIEAIELEACDIDPGASVDVSLFRFGALESGVWLVQDVSTDETATPGCDFFTDNLTDPETVDNRNHTYLVQVHFNGGSSDDTRVQAVRIFYRLQVSPPPGSATFSDVPTGHPFFRFVEALVASGITSGCGGNEYCPGAPLTRGQMAVFLAKALGLHWAP